MQLLHALRQRLCQETQRRQGIGAQRDGQQGLAAARPSGEQPQVGWMEWSGALVGSVV